MLEIKKLPDSEIEIFIEVPAEKFDEYCKETFEEISKNISVPGFRPGKVPFEIAEKNIKHEEILKKAAEKAIQQTYFPLLAEKKIESIGRPEITITKIAKGDSFCFKVKTAVLPEITLPDYKKIAAEIRVKESPTPAESEVGAPTPDAGGRDVGGEKGKEKEKQKRRMEILEAISNGSQMEIPEILVRAEKEKMLAELRSSIENMGMNWGDYLGQIKKTEDDLRKDWESDALRRIKYGLVLRELAEKENIQVTEGELEEEAGKILKQVPGLDRDYIKSYVYGIIRNEKVLNFLETC